MKKAMHLEDRTEVKGAQKEKEDPKGRLMATRAKRHRACVGQL